MNDAKQYKRKKFLRKITAIQFYGDENVEEVCQFCDGSRVYEDGWGVRVEIPLEARREWHRDDYDGPVLRVDPSDWVVKDKHGGFSVIDAGTFSVVYGEIE